MSPGWKSGADGPHTYTLTFVFHIALQPDVHDDTFCIAHNLYLQLHISLRAKTQSFPKLSGNNILDTQTFLCHN